MFLLNFHIVFFFINKRIKTGVFWYYSVELKRKISSTSVGFGGGVLPQRPSHAKLAKLFESFFKKSGKVACLFTHRTSLVLFLRSLNWLRIACRFEVLLCWFLTKTVLSSRLRILIKDAFYSLENTFLWFINQIKHKIIFWWDQIIAIKLIPR